MSPADRLVLFLAGLMGAAGVALAAAASHAGEVRLYGGASAMCLAHAPALIAIIALRRQLRFALPPAALMVAGTFIFAADLVVRARTGSALFAMAAPSGGMAMIAGWLALALAALLPGKRSK